MTKDWVHGVDHSLSARSCGYCFATCLDQYCWDVVNSGWLPFLQWSYCSFHFFAKSGMVVLCVCLGTVQYWWISTGLVIAQLRAVFSPLVQCFSFLCKAYAWAVLDCSSFPLFHSSQIFHKLVYPFAVVLPQIFFNLTTLFSYPVSLCLFRVPLDVVTHFSVLFRSFRFESRISAVTQGFSFWWYLPVISPKTTPLLRPFFFWNLSLHIPM